MERITPALNKLHSSHHSNRGLVSPDKNVGHERCGGAECGGRMWQKKPRYSISYPGLVQNQCDPLA